MVCLAEPTLCCCVTQAFIVRHLPMLVFGRKEGGPVAVAAAEACAATTPVESAAPAGELLTSMQVRV